MNEPLNTERPKHKAKVLALWATAIVLGILVALSLIVAPRLATAKARAQRINCVCREEALGIAFRGFGIDSGAFPMQVTNAVAPSASSGPQ